MFLGVVGWLRGFSRGWAALAVGMLTKPQAYLFADLWYCDAVALWLVANGARRVGSWIIGIDHAGALFLNGTIGELWERFTAYRISSLFRQRP